MIKINYTATYFKYSGPTPIHEEPTKKISNGSKKSYMLKQVVWVKAFGGGNHGYPGLGLLDVEYARILPTPTTFQAPGFPPALTIGALVTAL